MDLHRPCLTLTATDVQVSSGLLVFLHRQKVSFVGLLCKCDDGGLAEAT